MVSRSARRKRTTLLSDAEIDEMTLIAKNRRDVPEGKCWLCGADDHPMAAYAAAKGESLMNRRDPSNATWHILAAALGPIGERHEAGSAEWKKALGVLATAVGHFGGCIDALARQDEREKVTEKAVRAAALHALDCFFEAIVDATGEGTYVFELRRNRDGVLTHRFVQ